MPNWYLILIIAPKIRSMTISEKLQEIDKQNKYSGVRFGRVLIVGREILRIIDAASQAQGRARGAGWVYDRRHEMSGSHWLMPIMIRAGEDAKL